jgi:hypothetical protein
MDDPGFEITQGQEIFLFSKTPQQALCLLGFLFSEYRGFFPALQQMGCAVYHKSPSSAVVI